MNEYEHDELHRRKSERGNPGGCFLFLLIVGFGGYILAAPDSWPGSMHDITVQLGHTLVEHAKEWRPQP